MTATRTFHLGQCWMSETEPELGIGFIRGEDASGVTIEFPLSSETRRYNKRTAPLRRLEFRVGDSVQAASGERLTIESIETRDGILWYLGQGQELCESALSPSLKLQRPMERFLAGHWDTLATYDLRRTTLNLRNHQAESKVRGLLGPRVQLLPHQIYVTNEVSSRGLPRALLADEVGLGKTIEAGWMMHRLLVTGRARRILIITPAGLVNQWFIELFKKFNLSFWVPESQAEEEIEAEDLATEERVILSMESLSLLALRGIFDASQWDMIVVDEAHRISQTQDGEYEILKSLAEKSPGLLLLTATPEQLGIEGHFARLHLIDPTRFDSFERFVSDHKTYQEIVGLADSLLSGKALSAADKKKLEKRLEGKGDPQTHREIINTLIDYYGTGRVYFRNSRQVVELEHCFFPKRHLKRYPLNRAKGEKKNDVLLRWLGEFGREHKKEKTLLICSSSAQVIDWEKRLREEYALKVVAFHEALPLLARDRNAAYFEDPDGAAILLSSEIGGEGRNFQHATHLILPDLPADPDVLEQRIGRLDRIGQASDIEIHVPYEIGSAEEKLIAWHEEVFQSFDAPPKGAGPVFEKYKEELASATDETFPALIQKAQADFERTRAEIEKGRDRLIEIHSFDPEKAEKKLKEIQAAEKPEELREYLERVFDTLGIHSEDLDSDSLFVEPGDSMYVSYFPALPPEGLRMTFSRERSLARNDLTLMSWDHPMATETMETIATQEMGNVAIASWKRSQLLIDCTLILEPVATDSKWYADEFFPARAIRLAFDGTGADQSSDWPWENLKKEITAPTQDATRLARQIPGNKLRTLLRKALNDTEPQAEAMKKQAIDQMSRQIRFELDRLKALQSKNGLVSESEIQWWSQRKEELEKAYQGARLRLDSFLLVIPSR
ncbi:MAG: SNF2-related protein [Bdellovibrionia bacterium]